MGQDEARACPYVGPRAFVTGEPLYGRDREVQDLLDLVIAERIVVVHSPSGAGKSSLLQAGLIPRLRAEGFTVGSVIRVGFEPPERTEANRYTLSALLSLEESAASTTHVPISELARQDLAGYLGRRHAQRNTEAEVLIFDQFEEVLTLDPADHDRKLAFFAELANVLKQRATWAVFAIREDHLAALDPYRRLLPTRLTTTYRLDLLTAESALAAIQAPARAHGVDFTDAAAHKLVDDLRVMKVARPGGAVDMMPGRHVEAVQLQVVCRRLWDRLPAGDKYIDIADVIALGDVDQALADYCDAALAACTARTGVAERLLRAWMQRHLVTDTGLRTQVLLGSQQTKEIDARALASLTDAHLLRAEQRRGMHWLELAHDRLVAPLARSNQQWFAGHLSPLQRQAELWDSQGRPEALLLADPPAMDSQLTAVEQAFLTESKIRQARLRRLRLQRVAIVGLVMMLLAGLVIVFAVIGRYSHLAQQEAVKTADLAKRAAEDAEHAAAIALSRQLAAQSALQPVARADTAALLAVAASDIAAETAGPMHLLDLWARFPLLRDVVVTDASMLPWSVRADGSIVAVVDEYEHLHFWDLTRRARLGPPTQTFAYGAAISPTRPLALVSEPASTDLTVWDLGRMRPTGTLTHVTAFGGNVESITFSADGARFAAISGSGVVALRDSPDPTHEPRYHQGRSPIRSVALHPDGRRVAHGDNYGTIELADLSGQILDSLAVRHATITALRFDPTGDRLVAFDYSGHLHELTLGPADELAVRREISLGDAVFLDFSADLQSVLARHCTANCERAEAVLWDIATRQPRAVLDLSDAVGPTALLVGDTGRVVTGHPDGTVRSLDPMRRPQMAVHAQGAAALAISRDGRRLISAGCTIQGESTPYCTGEIQQWDRTTLKPLGPPLRGHSTGVRALQLFDDDRRLVSVDSTGDVIVWTLADGQQTSAPRLPASHLVPALTLDTSGNVLAAVADDTRIHSIDVLTGRTLTSLTTSKPLAIANSRDGQLAAAVCTKQGTSQCDATEVLLWPANTTTPHHLPSESVSRLAFAPDGQRLAAATTTGSVRLWPLPTGTPLDLPSDASRFPAADLRISDDGQKVVTISCADPTCSNGASVLHMWSATTGNTLSAPLLGHSRFILDVAPEQRDRRAVLIGPDSSFLVSGSLDGALLWDLDPEVLHTKACALAGRSFTQGEWTRFIGDARPYAQTCPARP